MKSSANSVISDTPRVVMYGVPSLIPFGFFHEESVKSLDLLVKILAANSNFSA